MKVSRAFGVAIAVLVCALSLVGIATAQTLKITLLGTGTPIPLVNRFGPSTLVEADDELLLFDCGRGVMQRLYHLGKETRTTKVFFTHLHSDHVNGFPDFWLVSWLHRRKEPLRVWGPRGTKEMTSNLEKAFQADYRIRTKDENLSPENFHIITTEIEEGVVYEKGNLKVTAFVVDHFPGEEIEKTDPTFGYRIDYAGHSVCISGDTRPTDNFVKFCKGVDVIIYEICAVKKEALELAPHMRPVVEHHTTPEQAGRIFSATNPKLAVYTHFVLLGTPEVPPPSIEDVITETRHTYWGPLVAGEDLMTIEIGNKIKVRRP